MLSNRASKDIKQKLIETQEEINNSTITVRDFNTCLLIIDRTSIRNRIVRKSVRK